MKYLVKLVVDGEEHEEEVNAPGAELAINKAKKLHPIRVVSVLPLEEQLDLDAEHHPGQKTVDDFGVPVDAGMAAVGDALAVAPTRRTRPTLVTSVWSPSRPIGADDDDDFGLGS